MVLVYRLVAGPVPLGRSYVAWATPWPVAVYHEHHTYTRQVLAAVHVTGRSTASAEYLPSSLPSTALHLDVGKQRPPVAQQAVAMRHNEPTDEFIKGPWTPEVFGGIRARRITTHCH